MATSLSINSDPKLNRSDVELAAHYGCLTVEEAAG
jgi:hypothetical protein